MSLEKNSQNMIYYSSTATWKYKSLNFQCKDVEASHACQPFGRSFQEIVLYFSLVYLTLLIYKKPSLKNSISHCCEAAPIFAQCLRYAWSILDACMLFGLFSTISLSDFDQRLFKWNWTVGIRFYWQQKKTRRIPVNPLLTGSKPIYGFVMHQNSMTVNCGTRERTCATKTMRSTHWQLLFLVYVCYFFEWLFKWQNGFLYPRVEIEQRTHSQDKIAQLAFCALNKLC